MNETVTGNWGDGSEVTKRLTGSWSFNRLIEGQGSMPAYTFRFSDDGACGIANANGHETPAEYTLDPSGTPKRMKWLNGAGPQRTEWRCVYELDGDGLKVGFVHPGTDIPADLTPHAGVTVYVLKRVTDDK